MIFFFNYALVLNLSPRWILVDFNLILIPDQNYLGLIHLLSKVPNIIIIIIANQKPGTRILPSFHTEPQLIVVKIVFISNVLYLGKILIN